MFDLDKMFARERIWGQIVSERSRQDAKFGPQFWPDGTGPNESLGLTGEDICMDSACDWARHLTDVKTEQGTLTWRDILLEEILESFAESDPVKLRTELIQSAAVIVAWVELIDSRGKE